MQPPNLKFADILFLAGFDEITKLSARQYFYVYGNYQYCNVHVLHMYTHLLAYIILQGMVVLGHLMWPMDSLQEKWKG